MVGRNVPLPRALARGLLLVPAILVTVAPASAQVFTGRIEVTVVDATGGVLPGATVEITGPQKATFVTGPDGVARFLNLEPGTYEVTATIQGFQQYQNTNVPVVAGGTMPLRVSLKIAGVEEQILVTAESPVIDTKKSSTSTSVTLNELQNIPSARDPWVVMQTVPGIVVSAVNVGGSYSGMQSLNLAKGAPFADNTWNMDGIPITDMTATGSTPTYYDFDTFQEMNVTTGGSDLTSSSGGVHLNFILKSATDVWHGSSRVYFENESMQANNMDSELASALGSPNGQGNRVDQYADYGVELGGPILKDRLWVWGSLGKTDVRTLSITQTPDRTILKNRAFKAQAQLSPSIRGSFTYFYGNKTKFGREASALRPPETTLNQNGPSPLYKGEVNFIIGHNLYLTARVSDFLNGFTTDPQGGMDKNIWRDDSGVWHGSYWRGSTSRPQQTVVADGSYFRGRHELKFGFSWRRATVESTSSVPGSRVVTYHDGYPDMIAEVWSDTATAARASYTAAWVGDTITLRRLTMNVGVRFDRQNDGLLASSVGAVPQFEAWLPALTTTPVPNVVVWNSISPRISASYALDESRKTLLRGAYALFASQLGNDTAYQVSTTGYRYIAFPAVDTNGNQIADLNEIDQTDVLYWYGFDLNDPTKLTTINQIRDYQVPKTHEIVIGLDRELMPNFGLSAAFTWRRLVGFNWYPRIGVTRADYVQSGTLTGSGLPDGSSYSVPYYALNKANFTEAELDAAQGTVLTGRRGYHQRFWGLEVAVTKRMSNHWMARAGFSTNKHQEFFDDPDTAIMDPTPAPGSPYVNGGLVATPAVGRSLVAMVMPKYQFIGNGAYQARYGIDLGLNVVLRQGFGQPWYQSFVRTGDYFNNRKTVAIYSDIDQNRLPTVTTVDIRVGWNPMKAFKVSRVGVDLDFDIFNVFNSGTVLGRQYDKRLTGATGFNQILEIMSPRILRLGARFTF
jgi:Carboxypeptidase regulatory-like domain